MEALQARVDSFKKSKRVRNTDKPSLYSTLKWPHPVSFQSNPETLAEAGFYWAPSYDDPDNVACFVCEKELGGWEEGDDPFELHWTKCGQTCCWAILRCGLQADLDSKGRFAFHDKKRHPTHKTMEKARLESYKVGQGWKHDKVKGHGASSKIMARAGFVYTPQEAGDDLATCLYCNTSLSGWVEGDDPLDEHRKRSDRLQNPCPFFTSNNQPTKPPSKSQSKPSSKANSRSKYQEVLAPTKTFDGEDDDEDTKPDTKAPTEAGSSSTTKTPRKPRSTRKSAVTTAKTPRSKTRSTSRSQLNGVAEDDETGNVDDPAVTQTATPATAKKKPRSRSKSVARSVVDGDDGREEDDDPPATVKKSTRSRSKSVARSEVTETEAEWDKDVEDPQQPSGSDRRKTVTKARKSRAKSRPPVEVEQEDEPEPPKKPSRSRAKKSVAPTPQPVSEAEVEEEIIVVPKKTSKSKAKSHAKDEVPDVEVQVEEAPPPKPAAKPKRVVSRSKSKAPPDPEDEDPFLAPPTAFAKMGSVRGSTAGSSKSKSKFHVPDARDLFNEDVEMDSYLPPPSPAEISTHSSAMDGVEEEMTVLLVPKRQTRPTLTPTLPPMLPLPDEDSHSEKEKPKRGRPPKTKKPDSLQSSSRQEVEDDGHSDRSHAAPSSTATRTGAPVSKATRPSATTNPLLTSINSKMKSRSQSFSRSISQQSLKVVEVSSDEEDAEKKMEEILVKVEEAQAELEPPSNLSRSRTPASVAPSKKPSSTVSTSSRAGPRQSGKENASDSVTTTTSTAGAITTAKFKANATPPTLPVPVVDLSKPPSSAARTKKKEKKTPKTVVTDADADVAMQEAVAEVVPVLQTEVPAIVEPLPDADVDMGNDLDVPPAPSTPPRPTAGKPKSKSKSKPSSKSKKDTSEKEVVVPPSTPPPAPSTPKNALPSTSIFTKPSSSSSSSKPPSTTDSTTATSSDTFIPPLSRLPFMPLRELTEPELDMTVEEWIRYQMDVEHDKFKRDGEREQERFKKRAEEVRRIIEGL